MQDPNEELLHWTQVMELTQTYYSSGGESADASTASSTAATGRAQWEDITADAFFSLAVSPGSKQEFLDRSERDPRDGVLLWTLESLLLQQTGKEPVSVTFSDQIAAAERETHGRSEAALSKAQQIRAMQYAFRKLRRSGLLYLEDDEADRHILLSFEAVLKPALLQLLQGAFSQFNSLIGTSK
ncbi:unnamed protein product [Phytophthora fragariaefolia]|uniref:Unnamed protein product n=1 Tax=Phytophthora fragariaefolia TaxID=1490495 RepID=A0A9W6WJL9_9STRA|nr:unnamed protein product [Phytophthora fragariaefolia]